jgi:hypothetical protein
MVVWLAIQEHQEPSAKLLIQGMMPVADGRLSHLCDQRLRVT